MTASVFAAWAAACLLLVGFGDGDAPTAIEVVRLHRRDTAKTLLSATSSRQLYRLDGVRLHGRFSELAYHFVQLEVGSPPQRFTAVLDTGSASFSLPCDTCNRGSCGVGQNRFMRIASTTLQDVACSANNYCDGCVEQKCIYTRSYSEGSKLTGIYVNDLVGLSMANVAVSAHANTPTATAGANSLRARMQLGCHMSEEGLISSQTTDGILGMSQGALSFIRALVHSGRISRNSFSICLSANGGRLALGGSDPRLANRQKSAEAGSTSMGISPKNGFYVVSLKASRAAPLGASAGSSAVRGSGRAWFSDRGAYGSGSGSAAVIDTGSSYTYIPPSALADVISGINEYCSPQQGNADVAGCKGGIVPEAALPEAQTFCVDLHGVDSTSEAIDSYPALQLQFIDGAVFIAPASKLLMQTPWTAGYHCLGVYSSDDAGGRVVIGANIMHELDVNFDVDGGVWSWTPADCGADDITPRIVDDTKSSGVGGSDSPGSRPARGAIDGISNDADRESTLISGSRLLVYGMVMGVCGTCAVVMGRLGCKRVRLTGGRAYTPVGAPSAAADVSAGSNAVGAVAIRGGNSTDGDDDADDEPKPGTGALRPTALAAVTLQASGAVSSASRRGGGARAAAGVVHV